MKTPDSRYKTAPQSKHVTHTYGLMAIAVMVLLDIILHLHQMAGASGFREVIRQQMSSAPRLLSPADTAPQLSGIVKEPNPPATASSGTAKKSRLVFSTLGERAVNADVESVPPREIDWNNTAPVDPGFLDSLTLKPRMQAPDIAIMVKVLSSAENYFEYGIGGSSNLAVAAGVKCLSALESSLEWIETVETVVQPFLDEDCSKLIHLNFGRPTGSWGTPSPESKHLYSVYSSAIQFSAASRVDTVLIDGRFRVACALQTWLAVDTNAIVMIHDFFRTGYHVVEEFYDVLQRGVELVVLKPNAEKRADPKVAQKVVEMLRDQQYVMH